MKVCKFGGTSVASATQIKKVVDIVLSDKERKIVVVSAPGKRSSDDTKVTDLLIELANRALSNEDTTEACANVIARYEEIAQELNIDPKIIETIRQDIEQRVQSSKEDEVLFMDSMKAAGEDNNAKLIAAYFQSLGVEARYVSPKEGGLLVNERPARVQALPEGDEQLAKLKDEKGIIVFPGFFGFTKNGT